MNQPSCLFSEKEVTPSSKVVDSCPRSPQYRNINPTGANKRRSLDPSLIYGSIEDIRADDPVFVIRRATSYRNSRRRSSVPLDELALSKLHRESTSSYNSSDLQSLMDDKIKRHEIIAAQRAATRATQRAIISAQSNSVRGMDVLLPGNAMLRSSRFDTNERMRYSYVEPDGETYDISDIVEEEWRDIDTDKDLLEGVFIRNKDGIGERLDRFINKIRKGKHRERDYNGSISDAPSQSASIRSVSPSEYSVNTETPSRSVTPGSAGFLSRLPNGVDQSSDGKTNSRPGTVTPIRSLPILHNRRHPSITSVISDYSGRSTPPSSLARVDEEKTRTAPRRIILPKDDFGLSQMMSIIEYKATKSKPKGAPPPHPVDELLFGVPLDLESLHPDIREIYAPSFRQLEEIDKVCQFLIVRLPCHDKLSFSDP